MNKYISEMEYYTNWCGKSKNSRTRRKLLKKGIKLFNKCSVVNNLNMKSKFRRGILITTKDNNILKYEYKGNSSVIK